MKSRWRAFLAVTGLTLGAAGCGVNGTGSLPGAATGGTSSAVAAPLPGGTWRLVSLREANGPEVAISRPELFTADFGADGRVHLRADCNRCTGTYGSGALSLSVGPMACTRAYCAATAPLDDTFTRLVGAAVTWSADGQSLQLASTAGALRFRR
jgi:heat shock protein HslJ